MAKRILILFFGILLLCSQAVLAADHVPFEYVIVKGDTVSEVVLKLTNSLKYRRDGIVVVTRSGKVRPSAKLDHIQPEWKILIDQSYITTVKVLESKGRTLAQVCSGSADPGCVRKLSRLNTEWHITRPLARDVFALPGMVTALAVSAPVSAATPVVAKAETPQPTPVTVASAQAAVPVPPSTDGDPSPPPPPLHPPSSSSSSPLLWLIPLGIIALGLLAWLIYTRYQRKLLARAEQARLAEIQREMEGDAWLFEESFKSRLNPSSNEVSLEWHYNPQGKQFETHITPVKGNYPNLTNHRVNLEHDLVVIGREFASKNPKLKIGTPYNLTTEGVGVPFAYDGGEM